MPDVLDIERCALLLELEAPFGLRELQLARRQLAKRWHPDIAPPGRQADHEQHLKAINLAADQLESILGSMPGQRVTAGAVRSSAAAARARRAAEGRRHYERSREQEEHSGPSFSRAPDASVVYRYARCLTYPEWGVGSVAGIYFTGEGDEARQWARVEFAHGVRTVPAGDLQFVDFSTPDRDAERAARFLTAAQNAIQEGDFGRAAQRLLYARDADQEDPAIHRLLTIALWEERRLEAAARAVNAWARLQPRRAAPHRYAARLYEAMGLLDLAAEAAERECEADPDAAAAWARLGRLRLRRMEPDAAVHALRRAGGLPDRRSEHLLDLCLAHHLRGEPDAAADAAAAAVELNPQDPAARERYVLACERAGRSMPAAARAA